MDEATKAGYGVLLMRQALPKSEFYARTTANIRAGLQEPAPGPADTLPFGVLGRGPTRKPLDLAKDAHVAALAARLDEFHGAPAPAAGGCSRSDEVELKAAVYVDTSRHFTESNAEKAINIGMDIYKKSDPENEGVLG